MEGVAVVRVLGASYFEIRMLLAQTKCALHMKKTFLPLITCAAHVKGVNNANQSEDEALRTWPNRSASIEKIDTELVAQQPPLVSAY